jgi:hypothetical protein
MFKEFDNLDLGFACPVKYMSKHFGLIDHNDLEK